PSHLYPLSLHDALPILAPTVAAEVSGVSAFSRFRLGRDLTFNANAPVNRLPLFQRARLAVVERNVFENEYNTQTLGRGGFTLLRSEEHTSELQSLAYLV